MFTLANYVQITPCIRGEELLSKILNKRIVSNLWINREHIFLTTNEDNNLHAFDVVPQLRWRRSGDTKTCGYVLDAKNESVFKVIWDRCEPSVVLVICENGATHFWEFLRPSHEWIKHKSIQLSNAKGSMIVSVKLYKERGNLVWCERRGFGVEAHCVCIRNVTIRDANGKVKIEVGTTQAILHNSPVVDIFCFNSGICLHPCQVFLERIFLFWTCGHDLKAVVLKNDRVQEAVICGSDFRDILITLVGSWTDDMDDTSTSWLGIALHPSHQDIIVLNKSGVLSKVVLKSNLVKCIPVCSICLPSSSNQIVGQMDVFTDGVVFGLVDFNSVVFLYDIFSGKLLQSLEDFKAHSEHVNILTLTSQLSTTVFWKSDGIWTLQCSPLTDVIKAVNTNFPPTHLDNIANKEAKLIGGITGDVDAGNHARCELQGEDALTKNKHCVESVNPENFGVVDMARWLSVFGLEQSAAVLLLENLISRLEKQQVLPETVLQFLKNLGKNVSQNPTLLLTFFDKDVMLKEDSINELKHFLEDIDQSATTSVCMTPLNMQLLPFLREFFEKCSEQQILSSLELRELRPVLSKSVTSDVSTAVETTLTGMANSVCLEKVEILSLHEPELVVEAFPYDKMDAVLESNEDEENSTFQLIRAELNDRRWRRRQNPDNATIFRIFFQLLYSKHAETLLHVIDMARRSVAIGSSQDEATLQDLQEVVREFIFDFLPSIWCTKDCNKEGIKIHVELLKRLGLQREALESFLHRKLWNEAVDYYVEISRHSSDLTFNSQLFQMLVSSLLRGVATREQNLLSKLFELKPEVIGVHNLFELCLRNLPEDCKDRVFDEDSLTVGEAKHALVRFLREK